MTTTSKVTADVEARVAALNGLLSAHAGGLDFESFDKGVASVVYTGMCQGCVLRPLTTTVTVRPALLSIPGVNDVHVRGSDMSDEARTRISNAIRGGGADR